ncbi:hypothetical protein KM1_208040 [Entamoeba histolytica HM-3:IMSS]|uniref:Uncharacterized protein n=1 Tax=Entamoeba histolytica HM-3:IMSS TaxID=885315 RepID=M7W337_ENTHI|nr:hypothetical protein KM1_208040 [Entamoeba histolytica HM-3:IMSS]
MNPLLNEAMEATTCGNTQDCPIEVPADIEMSNQTIPTAIDVEEYIENNTLKHITCNELIDIFHFMDEIKDKGDKLVDLYKQEDRYSPDNIMFDKLLLQEIKCIEDTFNLIDELFFEHGDALLALKEKCKENIEAKKPKLPKTN